MFVVIGYDYIVQTAVYVLKYKTCKPVVAISRPKLTFILKHSLKL